MFKIGSIIRNIKTGKIMKVLHSYKEGTIVVDLKSKQNPMPTYTLLERDWDQWEDEAKLSVKEKKGEWWTDERELIWSNG